MRYLTFTFFPKYLIGKGSQISKDIQQGLSVVVLFLIMENAKIECFLDLLLNLVLTEGLKRQSNIKPDPECRERVTLTPFLGPCFLAKLQRACYPCWHLSGAINF